MFTIEMRPEPSKAMSIASPALAAVAMLITGFLVFTLLGRDPAQAFYVFFVKPIGTRYGFGELLLKATPLILCGVGLALCYRTNVWNIGAEGQFTFGAIVGGGVALFAGDTDNHLVVVLMLVAGALGGALWAAIPAYL